MISVIMPAYNGEQFIAQSIMSVLNQTFTDFELIVVDDGSTDRTAEIVSKIQRQDDRVKFFRQENSGQAAARNIGISKSQGDLIAFLDQDDLWIEQKLELQTKAIEASGADIVFSGGYIFSGADVACETISFAQVEGKLSGPEMFRLLFIGQRRPTGRGSALSECRRLRSMVASGSCGRDLSGATRKTGEISRASRAGVEQHGENATGRVGRFAEAPERCARKS